MIRVYIALGSNLAQPLQQVKTALEALEHLPRTRLVACSAFYRTRPLGAQDQPDFLNAVVALDTALPPEQLLDHTQEIERNQAGFAKISVVIHAPLIWISCCTVSRLFTQIALPFLITA